MVIKSGASIVTVATSYQTHQYVLDLIATFPDTDSIAKHTQPGDSNEAAQIEV